MTPFDHALAALLALVLPLYYLARNPATKRAIEAGDPGRRVRDYHETLAELWLQGLAVAALWAATGRDWALLGLIRPGRAAFWIGALLLAGLVVFGVYQFRAVRGSAATRAALRERMAHLAYLLPTCRRERRLFALLSVSAGVCEEIAYRGFLIWYISAWLDAGAAAAVALSSVAFGLAHLYLGWRDAARAALTGAVLAGVYLLTGSLWLAMALHAMIDLNSGAIGGLVFSAEGQQ